MRSEDGPNFIKCCKLVVIDIPIYASVVIPAESTRKGCRYFVMQSVFSCLLPCILQAYREHTHSHTDFRKQPRSNLNPIERIQRKVTNHTLQLFNPDAGRMRNTFAHRFVDAMQQPTDAECHSALNSYTRTVHQARQCKKEDATLRCPSPGASAALAHVRGGPCTPASALFAAEWTLERMHSGGFASTPSNLSNRTSSWRWTYCRVESLPSSGHPHC